MQNYIYKAVAKLTKILAQISETEYRPFDQARILILHTMFIAMAAQRHLIPNEMALSLKPATEGDVTALFTKWDAGKMLCGVSTIPLSNDVIAVLRAVFDCAEGKVWPSHWLGGLLDGVDAYARYHKEDGAQASYTRRHNGVYYTSSQLVKLVIQETLKPILCTRTTVAEVLSLKVIDPAVGGANFLVEMVHQLAQALHDRNGGSLSFWRHEVLKHCIYGIDIDPVAVTVARCTLWLETNGGDTRELMHHIIAGDSLLGAHPTGIEQFDVVIGNPPWNKLKADLKEFYGYYDPAVFGMQGSQLKKYVEAELVRRPELQLQWQKHRKQVQSYLRNLLTSSIYVHQNARTGERLIGGDPDLYKFFLERSLQLVRPAGRIALLLPAALCTTKGAMELRRMLLAETRIDIFVTIENKDRLFPIDSRFKYLILVAEKGRGPTTVLPSRFMLTSVDRAEAYLSRGDLLSIPVEVLTAMSPNDVTFADVREQRDIQLLEKLHRQFPPLGIHMPDTWNVQFVRELDMTNDSHLFWSRDELEQQGYQREPCGCYKNPRGQEMVPLVEGRMVHQFDSLCKAYVHGHGRKAIWKELSWNHKQIGTHFYIARDIAAGIAGYNMPRAGYCDITGQTNERTVLAALIAGGCVAGNKVPTLRISGVVADYLEITLLWIAIANSFVVDWLMRMRMSTTINYFHWYQIPFPRILPTDPRAKDLIAASTRLSIKPKQEALIGVPEEWVPSSRAVLDADREVWSRQFIRAELDARIAALYGLSVHDYAYILTTFPLLDRSQPSLPGDYDTHGKPHSYITRDLALLTYFRFIGIPPPENLVAFFDEIGINIDPRTQEVRNLEERVERAHSIGAVAYLPTGSKIH